jgi:hypothetical protein
MGAVTARSTRGKSSAVDSVGRRGDGDGMVRLRSPALALIVLALVGCGSDGGTVLISAPPPRQRSPASPYVPPPAMRRTPLPSARLQTVPGIEGVIGAGEAELVRQFGPARLDVWEADARKLQFSALPCVLDVFLYPAQGGERRATYVEARRSTDGREVDRAACIAALRAAKQR